MSTPLVVPKFEGDYRFLSNFYPSPITIEPKSVSKITFPTGEHMFQALKYKAMAENDQDAHVLYVASVNRSADPNHAKKMGRKVKIDVAKWESIRIEMMRQVVWEKFKQNQNLVPGLLDTDSAMLVEGNTWGDEFWGRVDGRGYNLLGSILMEVRGFYRWNGASQKWSK
jgi:ribA/ribD-fused uncharacterized protein